MVTGAHARDGRTTMRIVFANAVENILKLPSGPNGRIPDATVLAMRLFEATAHPWIRDDEAFLAELRESQKLSGDVGALARWSAVLAGLQRAQMLDKASTPYDSIGSDDEGVEEQA